MKFKGLIFITTLFLPFLVKADYKDRFVRRDEVFDIPTDIVLGDMVPIDVVINEPIDPIIQEPTDPAIYVPIDTLPTDFINTSPIDTIIHDGILNDTLIGINLNDTDYSAGLGDRRQNVILNAPTIQATDATQLSPSNNLVLYWGQGDTTEKRLAYYCDQEGVSIVVLAFVVDFVGGFRKSPILNLSDNCDDVNNCNTVALDAKYCQKKNIKVLLSVGGAIGPYHQQAWDPDLFAWWMWHRFLGGDDKRVSRPFGDVILDGVDFDPESVDGVGYDRMIHVLRQLFNTYYPSRKFLISAAPQCADLDYYPHNAAYNILNPDPKYDAYPDYVFVQFYNNRCSVSKFKAQTVTDFNFAVWDKWSQLKTGGKAKVVLGLMGKETKTDTGYIPYEKLTTVLSDIKRYKSFGGVMFWDASLAYSNPVTYLKGIPYGQATAKYLQQLSMDTSKTAAAFEVLNIAFQSHGVPLMVPISPTSSDAFAPLFPCSGQSFILLRSVTKSVLFNSFGSSSQVSGEAQEMIIDDDAPINPGSHVCMGMTNDSELAKVSFIYNASIPSHQLPGNYY
ncbi:glycoside hydrolase superfamily [Pilobolus umbonatus]|nr:glycoside hydrolase superfamily [Pilobolus umbonatus]